MTATLGWGIAGTGWIADRFAADLALVPEAGRFAVLSRDAASAENFRSRHGFSRAFTEIEDFLASSGIDVVYVATPNATHETIALAAIAAGKAVLVEKPLAVSAKQARQISAAATERGVFLMEAMWTRFLPAVVEARRAVDAGSIGTIRRIEAELAFPKPFDPASRFFEPEGGGALLDLGIYPLSLALAFLGRPETVDGAWRAAGSGVDMTASVTLEWRGADARITTGFDREGANVFVVRGETGAMRIDRHFLAARSFTRFSGEGPRLATGYAARLLDRLPRYGKERILLPHMGNGLVHQILAVHSAIGEGRTGCGEMPVPDSIAALDIIAKVRERPPASDC